MIMVACGVMIIFGHFKIILCVYSLCHSSTTTTSSSSTCSTTSTIRKLYNYFGTCM